MNDDLTLNEAEEASRAPPVIHGAGLFQWRLHKALEACNVARSNLNFPGWKRSLDIVRSELEWKITPTERKKFDDPNEILQQVNEAMGKWIGFHGTTSDKWVVVDGVYSALDKYERFLRRILGKAGMLGPDSKLFDTTAGL